MKWIMFTLHTAAQFSIELRSDSIIGIQSCHYDIGDKEMCTALYLISGQTVYVKETILQVQALLKGE